MKYLDHVPQDLQGNLEWRQRVLFECRRKSGRYRRAVLHMCERDPLFFIAGFCMQLNPLLVGREAGPFIPWESQQNALVGHPGIFDSMTMGYDLTVQKSREEGGSYLVILAYLHRWRFKKRQKFLMISHAEEMVWNPGDHDALFSKVEYVLDNLPEWMRGGWKKGDFDTWRTRYARCPESGGVWTGKATTKKTSIGGRYSSVMYDEFAHVVFGKLLRERTAATSRSRIFVSTHAGVDTEFAKLCDDPKVQRVVLHWSDHPRKRAGAYRWDGEKQQIEVIDKQYQFPPDYEFDTSGEPLNGYMPGLRSVFYDKEAARIGDPAAVAEELDINRAGGTKYVFDPVLIAQHALRAVRPWWEGDLAFDSETARPHGLVEQPGGPIKLWGVRPNRKGLIDPGIFAAGADISQGTGNTPSSLSMGDVSRRAKVLELCRADLDPREFAAIVVALCRLFADENGQAAFMCFESAGPVGGSFEKRCVELRFSRMYQRATSKKFTSTVGMKKYGWMPTADEKDRLLLEYGLALKRGAFHNPSKSSLLQCNNFRKNAKGHAEHPKEVPAPPGSGSRYVHGDIVIADGQLCMMFSYLGGAEEPVREETAEDESSPMNWGWRYRQFEAEQAELGSEY